MPDAWPDERNLHMTSSCFAITSRCSWKPSERHLHMKYGEAFSQCLCIHSSCVSAKCDIKSLCLIKALVLLLRPFVNCTPHFIDMSNGWTGRWMDLSVSVCLSVRMHRWIVEWMDTRIHKVGDLKLKDQKPTLTECLCHFFSMPHSLLWFYESASCPHLQALGSLCGPRVCSRSKGIAVFMQIMRCCCRNRTNIMLLCGLMPLWGYMFLRCERPLNVVLVDWHTERWTRGDPNLKSSVCLDEWIDGLIVRSQFVMMYRRFCHLLYLCENFPFSVSCLQANN